MDARACWWLYSIAPGYRMLHEGVSSTSLYVFCPSWLDLWIKNKVFELVSSGPFMNQHWVLLDAHFWFLLGNYSLCPNPRDCSFVVVTDLFFSLLSAAGQACWNWPSWQAVNWVPMLVSLWSCETEVPGLGLGCVWACRYSQSYWKWR